MNSAENARISEARNPNRTGITGSSLKIIAIIAMTIDHIGAIVLERALIQLGFLKLTDLESMLAFQEANAGLYYSYLVSRIIGRIAFPIFCFLIVEGFLHTHNLKKYLGRMFLFAFLSELPFDLAFSGKLFYWQYQNIFFTLFFGIVAIAGIRVAEEKKEWNKLCRVLFGVFAVCLSAGAAVLLKTDYDMLGVLAIAAIYLFREKKTLSVGIGCAVLMEITAFVSLIPVYLYNGERGKNSKWFFYLFYPVHILLLYLIACGLGLQNVPLVG